MATIKELSHMVMKSMGQENARKQRILARSPHLSYALDAGTYEGMSPQELAKRENDELGIKPDDRSIDEQLLDAHHAGRQFARDGGKRMGSSANDASDASSVDSFFDKYIRGE